MKSWILQYIKSGLVMKSWLFYLVLICHENIDFSLQSHVVMKIWPFLPVLNCHEPRTWHSYFWSCHPWLDSFTSDLVIYDFTLIILVLSAMTCLSYFWSCQLRLILAIYGLPTTNCLSTFWSGLWDLTFISWTEQIRLDFPTSDLVNTYWRSLFWSWNFRALIILLALS